LTLAQHVLLDDEIKYLLEANAETIFKSNINQIYCKSACFLSKRHTIIYHSSLICIV